MKNDSIPGNITHLSRYSIAAGTITGTTLHQPKPEQQRKFVAKGHDAQLQDAQMGKLPVTLTMISGETASGQIVKRDKYTITVRYSGGTHAGMDEIFYKHAIEGVLIDRSSQA